MADTTDSAPDFAAAWLTEAAWPLWLRHGVDWQAGGFIEALHPESLEAPADYRRLRVVTRQIAVFAQATERGVPRAVEAVALGVRFLRRHARQPDGGYAWRFGLDNEAIDQTRDLYDHAFVLLALAHAARVLDDDALAGDARDLVAYLDSRFAHPEGGYREAIPDRLPRRQNPHMHLLEALLAAYEGFGDLVYLDRAEALVDLLLDRLLDGALPEFFDDALNPERDAQGRFTVEPGHHFEWAWLLDAYLATGCASRAGEIEAVICRLMDHAETHGIDPGTGLVLDAITSDGTEIDRSFRLWPQTERLKAALCRPDLARVDAGQCLVLLLRYFDGVTPGLWRERMLPEGPVLGEASPASSLYHLTGALLYRRKERK